MKKKERNDRMRQYLKMDFSAIECGAEYRDAIRECDRKARAWDALEEQIPKMSGNMDFYKALNLINATMINLLCPPKPKSKLERLREFIEGGCNRTDICFKDILDEIERLEAEDDPT